ncbi:O-acetylhomoserine/O-acetylserine sulfhydrylase [Denitrovibrio acetiphilus DSM 12809]|uniref:O-acetylhomoserine/O-acetylserine sulfhydrylase n=1 Tax=Denitrovibrio acetiphilus (strain DSM 12809 / NBRC 114555 / N2460) TaxID=522772 RepID=D4H5Q2_DENA2|nr:O-acetylhomoserine aminocarboxypropyltransferase/cysteine synthase family protein [Denitrovibrio acetiphilus]ADD69493.1 O-acetylhomoserine/O-acetylserine sulfhydrylase [Denitrovibrio acetiphilus DSM 12809]
MSDHRFETIAIHGGYRPDEKTGATQVPIYHSNAFEFKGIDHAVSLFDLKAPGHIYSRLSNPTVEVLENRIAMLEGGSAAVCTAAGQFATYMAITTLAEAGDNIVASGKLYGGTYNLFVHTFKKLGIEFRLVDQDNLDAYRANIDSKTKAIYIESVSNPASDIPDIDAVSAIAKEYKVPLIVDNTYTSPFLFKPIEHGADIVLHSMTKFIGGHGSAMGGVVVDAGTFDWKGSGRFPGFTEPDPSYHGVVYAEEFGNMALAIKMRVQILRDVGGCLSPSNAFQILCGLETLALRMERHCANAYKLAGFLLGCEDVEWVNYPDLPDNRNYHRVKELMPKGSGAMMCFGLKGGFERAKTFIENVKIAIHATNLGDVRTIVTHPASTTHRQLSEEQLNAAGIPQELIRVAVGIENIDDIIEDFEQAMKAGK